MPWILTTNIAILPGQPYTTTVQKPAGFKRVASGGAFGTVAIESSDGTYKLPYEKHTGAKASTDVWHLGVVNSGDPTRSVTVKAVVGRTSKGEDKPTVADGEGGGPGAPGGGFVKVTLDIPIPVSRYY